MRRFFFSPDQDRGTEIILSGSEARHLASVLRMEPGTPVTLYDGLGSRVQGEIERVSRDSVVIRVVARSREPEPSRPLFLAQAMLKGKKMDLLVQKATELGVHAFQPLLTRFCAKRKQGERQGERWQRIILEACKQCGRPLPMQILEPVALNDFLPPARSDLVLPWEDEQSRPLSRQLLQGKGSVCILVGPEGGFHPAEVDTARSLGFTTVSLGPRILRAETAALTCTGIVQYLCGELAPEAQLP